MKTIKQGYIGKEVGILCSLLKISGRSQFDEEMREKVISFQRSKGLDADGIVGPATWLELYLNSRSSNSPNIQESDYVWAGEYLGCSSAAVHAVVEVETGGRSGFLSSGNPQVLFEGHIFWRELKERGIDPEKYASSDPDIVYKSWDKSKYKGGESEWARLEKAMKISRPAAICSASFGLFQILGNNYSLCLCKSPEEFFNKMCESEILQFSLGLAFIEKSGLSPYLASKDWAGFAKRYNGPGYASNSYDTKLAQSYKKFS